MEKASRRIVAAFGVLFLIVMALAAFLLPSEDASDFSIGLVTRADFMRGGFCLVFAGVSLHVVSGGLVALVTDYPRESPIPARPPEATVIGAVGTGLASMYGMTGVFYATRALEFARTVFALASLVTAFFAFFVAFAFVRAGRAVVIAYVAIGVGLAHGALSLLTVAFSDGSTTRGLPGSLATAAFAILVVMLGFVVAAGAD